MAYINVAEWTPEHVAEWLRGLEDSVLPYVHFFLNNGVDGHQLLNLSPDDLNNLHILKIGHQELILEAVELLRQLHYGLTSETLQFLALKLGCKARSLYSDLKLNGPHDIHENIKQEPVSTDTLSAVSEILVSVKSLISWLDRYPFAFQDQYVEIRKAVLKLSIELASTAQRDQFVERPHFLIKNSCLSLAEICDCLVQDFNDSLIIQPASLDITTIKKKPDEELGIHIQSTYSGIHIVGGIKSQSPAMRCTKVEEGDEIVQVNYQTVIGWQLKKLVYAMREHSSEVHLTLKKRPRHTNILGQVIILRPYRIPSKKTAFGKMHKWSEGSTSHHIQEAYSVSNDSENSRGEEEEEEDDDDSAFLPDSSVKDCPTHSISDRFQLKMVPSLSHAKVQRRATVSGASPTVTKAPVSIEDLVNGVPSVKRKENIIRSISHDPSNIGDYSRNLVICKGLEILKSNDSEEELRSKIKLMGSKKQINNSVMTKQKSTSKNSNACEVTAEQSPLTKPFRQIQTSTILSAHEEEHAMLENKSLQEMKTENFLQPYRLCCLKKDDLQENSACEQNNDLCMALSTSDEYYCGPRNAADKLDKFHPLDCNQFIHERVSATDDVSSYQVVVVGGVPQKYPTKRQDILVSPQKRTTTKFGNRRISCKDLGMGDCQGWLYKQKDKTAFFSSVSQWTKRWIVLKNHYLYCYKDQNDDKAECLIFLPGSTVSPAMECRTKKFCFKICHQSAVFYFATETQADLSKWLNKMGLAAIAYDASADITTSGFSKPETSLVSGHTGNFYSESEDSDDVSRTTDMAFVNKKFGVFENSPNSSFSYEQSHDKYQRKKYFGSSHVKSKNIYCENERKMKKKIHSHDEQILSRGLSREGNIGVYDRITECNSDTSSSKEKVQNLHSIFHSERKNIHSSYDKSFSCSEAKSFPDEKTFPSKKPSCESSDTEFSYSYNNTELNKEIILINPWLEPDEEHDILTASLGRQKPIAKEISPGLVARMAVSYSNLAQHNIVSNSCSKNMTFKNIPSPGYVAKISDSFNHWAKIHCESNRNSNQNGNETINDPVSGPNKVNAHSYQRSASESHVGHNTYTSSYKSSKVSPSQSLATRNVVSYGDNSCAPKKQLSILDREYYRLYGRNKVSQVSLKSFNKPCTSEKGMKYFPDSANISQVLQNQSIMQEKYICSNEEVKKNRESNSRQNAYHSKENNLVDDFEVCPKLEMNVNFTTSGGKLNNISTTADPLFTPHLKLDTSKGIENIGFSSLDHVNNDDHLSKDMQRNDLMKDNENIGNQNLKSSSNNLDPNNALLFQNISPLPQKTSTLELSTNKVNSSFKLFGSPKFMKKLNSPKLDKKNIFKSKKAKETKRAEQKDVTNVQNERKLFGSPRLARAIFGSPKVHKKTVHTTSSGVQTDSVSESIGQSDEKHSSLRNKKDILDTAVKNFAGDSSIPEHCANEIIKSSSNSSLNSDASSSVLSASTSSSHYYVETRIKPQITISLPFITDKYEERAFSPDLPRTPVKPTMGVTMLGKRRLPSVSGESSVSVTSSKSSHEEASYENQNVYSEVKMETGCHTEDDEMVRVLDSLRRASLTVDGVDLRERRCRPFAMNSSNKHLSQLVLELQALQRTLKDKEGELDAISELCSQTDVNHEVLTKWIDSHPDMFLESTM